MLWRGDWRSELGACPFIVSPFTSSPSSTVCTCTVQGHQLWTYETEGGNLDMVSFSSFDTMSGQSYSFLIHANQVIGRGDRGG